MGECLCSSPINVRHACPLAQSYTHTRSRLLELVAELERLRMVNERCGFNVSEDQAYAQVLAAQEDRDLRAEVGRAGAVGLGRGS